MDNRKTPRLAGILLAALIVFSACGGGKSGPAVEAKAAAGGDRFSVFVVNYPLQYFATRIGGNLIDVRFPMAGKGDPAYWSPTPETVASYQSADLILLNGAGYAKWVDHATLPISKLVDTSASFSSRYIKLEGTTTHSHGSEGAHEHTGWAFTTWLDPTLAVEQAQTVSRALIAQRPVYEAVFNERYIALEVELLALDARLAAAAEAIGNTPLVFSHPVYQYLQRRYDLNGVSLHWEPDQPPDAGELRRVLAVRPRWLVWEAEPTPETIAQLESVGVTSVVYDPCATAPDSGDFMTVMAANAAALERIAGR